VTTFRRRHDHDDRPGHRRRWLRAGVLVPAGAVGAALLAVGLVLFEPWTLFVDDVVDEALSVSAAAEPTAGTDGNGSGSDATAAASAAEAAPAPVGPVTLLKGRFISHEHGTSGSAKLLKLEDGSRVLRIEGLDTSNGPDLRVWLADAPVRKGRAGWFVFDDRTHIDLGALKGNIGNQNYAVPADADLDTLRSVSIWCARFRVSFGAAALA
jgi:hypothetical protein